jgi:hypothetical protein
MLASPNLSNTTFGVNTLQVTAVSMDLQLALRYMGRELSVQVA